MNLVEKRTLGLLLTGREAEVPLASFSDSDWAVLAQNAYGEGLGPLLYWRFSRSEIFSSLPGGTQNSLRLMYASAFTQNQVRFKELAKLSALFHQAEIPVVALKGACLALTVYPDIGLRPMGDLDILVPKHMLAGAVEIAQSLGYQDSKPEASPGLNEILLHHVCLYKSSPQAITLEIHDRLAGEDAFSFAVPVDWFWEQTEPLITTSKFQYPNLLMLSPEAQILYAAGHAMLQHGGDNSPMRWFYDLDLLIHHYRDRLDWDLLLSQARIFEWGSALDAALGQANAYFATPIPDPVLAALKGTSDRHRDLVSIKKSHPATHILVEGQKLRSLNWYGRIRLALALIFPTPAYMRWRYGVKKWWLVALYYPYRWWVIFMDGLRTLAALVR